MEKIVIPKRVRILTNNKTKNGGISTHLDSPVRCNNMARHVLGPKWKAKSSKLAQKAAVQLNSVMYDNLVGYRPKIGIGFLSDTRRHYSWWFTAPNGTTKLPVSSNAIGVLLDVSNIKTGEIQELCIIQKKGQSYSPIPIDHPSIKNALQAATRTDYKKIKDITVGSEVYFRGEKFAYLGMYTSKENRYFKMKRGHVLFNFDNNKFVSKAHYGDDEIIECNNMSKEYVNSDTKDFSRVLTKSQIKHQYADWSLFSPLFGKTNADLRKSIRTLELKGSGTHISLTNTKNYIVWHSDNKPYFVNITWGSGDVDLVPATIKNDIVIERDNNSNTIRILSSTLSKNQNYYDRKLKVLPYTYEAAKLVIKIDGEDINLTPIRSL